MVGEADGGNVLVSVWVWEGEDVEVGGLDEVSVVVWEGDDVEVDEID